MCIHGLNFLIPQLDKHMSTKRPTERSKSHEIPINSLIIESRKFLFSISMEMVVNVSGVIV